MAMQFPDAHVRPLHPQVQQVARLDALLMFQFAQDEPGAGQPSQFLQLWHRFGQHLTNVVVDELPVELTWPGFCIGPVEPDIRDRARKAGFGPRAALLAHSPLPRIGKERVHLAKPDADAVCFGTAARQRHAAKHRKEDRDVGPV